jgi:hypothetical protein
MSEACPLAGFTHASPTNDHRIERNAELTDKIAMNGINPNSHFCQPFSIAPNLLETPHRAY